MYPQNLVLCPLPNRLWKQLWNKWTNQLPPNWALFLSQLNAFLSATSCMCSTGMDYITSVNLSSFLRGSNAIMDVRASCNKVLCQWPWGWQLLFLLPVLRRVTALGFLFVLFSMSLRLVFISFPPPHSGMPCGCFIIYSGGWIIELLLVWRRWWGGEIFAKLFLFGKCSSPAQLWFISAVGSLAFWKLILWLAWKGKSMVAGYVYFVGFFLDVRASWSFLRAFFWMWELAEALIWFFLGMVEGSR